MLKDNLKLNDDETEFLIWLAHHNSWKGSTARVSVIQSVLTVRNLGSWFDSRLSKSKHITKICRFFIFWFVQHTTHQELSLTNINRDTHSLCSFNEHKFCHTTPLIVELHWLPIRFRIVYFKILIITFKFLHGLAPSYLSSLISFRRQTRCNLRNSNHNLLLSYPSFISKLATLGDRSFTYAAPRLCNALPFDVRYTKSVNVFKVKLKTHLFSSALLLSQLSIYLVLYLSM